VLVILLDDVGFGASSAFGGPCQTLLVIGLLAIASMVFDVGPFR
jgi:arylsulfatase A-like enzyme